MPSKKVGFYCQLPEGTKRIIKTRALKTGVPQWAVVNKAITGQKLVQATGGYKHQVVGDCHFRGGPRRKARGARG
jgi:hypothetical protein